MKVHFLKTQWSDMIILESNGKYAIVDTGFYEQFPELQAYLEKLQVNEIEFILLTHFHRDHYGNINNLVDNYHVHKVYFKEYGGHDSNTAWGSPADEAYREAEREKWANMRDHIIEKSELIMVEGINNIMFEGTELKLYFNQNIVQAIYDDETYPETYHNNKFSENQNSLGVFFESDGKTVFLGGDIMDVPASHPLANYANSQIAKMINREIYLYKAPHHGTIHTATMAALNIYKPQVAVITNAMEWLSQYDAIDNLKAVNPEVEIYITEHNDVVVDLENGKVVCD